MIKHNSMSDALRNRKAQGLDLTIVIGGAKPVNGDDEEQEKLGLAPSAEEIGEEHGENPPVDGNQVQGQIVTQPNDKKLVVGDSSMEHPDEMQDKQLIEHELAKAGLGKSSLAHRAMMMKGKK